MRNGGRDRSGVRTFRTSHSALRNQKRRVAVEDLLPVPGGEAGRQHASELVARVHERRVTAMDDAVGSGLFHQLLDRPVVDGGGRQVQVQVRVVFAQLDRVVGAAPV